MSDIKKIKLTALWSKTVTTKNGPLVMMSGYLGDTQIEIWPNQYKKSENHPDYTVYLAPKYKSETKKAGKTDDEMKFDEYNQNMTDFGGPPLFDDIKEIPF